jgi:hypothetical protein
MKSARPSAGEMLLVRAIMLGAMVVIAIALVRHQGKIFDFAAITIVASSGLVYRATYARPSDRLPPNTQARYSKQM